MSFQTFLQKLQSMPESRKKIVLWTIVGILAVVMGLFWVKGSMDKLSRLNVQIPNLELPENSILDTTSPSDQPAFMQQNQTTDWKTYTNNQYGFEIKYPRNGKCEFLEVKKQEPDFTYGRIELVIENSQSLDLSHFVDEFLLKNTENWTIEKKENITVVDNQAIRIGYRFGGLNRYGEAVFIENNQNIYLIGFTGGAFECSEPQIFDQMLSTLKFTK
jgi:hypothetical protein